MPLEDELEALCRLHSARAELVLSGDSARFAAVASTVEAFPFREDDTDGDDEEGGSADFAPPPAIFSTSPSAAPAAGGGGGDGPVGQGAVEEDISARRLSVLENCLDAFERLVSPLVVAAPRFSRRRFEQDRLLFVFCFESATSIVDTKAFLFPRLGALLHPTEPTSHTLVPERGCSVTSSQLTSSQLYCLRHQSMPRLD